MDVAIEQLQAKDTKERMAGVERLQILLEESRKGLSANEVGNLVDASLVLLKDSNFRVSQGTLQALASAAALAGEHLKLHFNSLLPAIVERLGDGKQPVRDAGRRLLLALMEISSPTIIVERAGNFAWAHKNWRVREEFARSVASAINLFAATELPFQRMVLPSVLQLLEDSNNSVREAAMLCSEEMYRQGGSQFKDELHGHQLRSAQLKDITSRFDKIDPVRSTIETMKKQLGTTNSLSSSGQFGEAKLFAPTTTYRRSSWKLKGIASEMPMVGGESEAGEKPVDPIRLYSEKDLTKEVERAAGLLTAEQDWSVRIAAMQRIEGLLAGGACEYVCFLPLMKQLVGPLNAQLSDRRSSIVKQACHLLNLLAMELLGDFEIFAESFIPVLFKLVVITVLVIAESADTCIKTMLRNCRVARVLPKLMECAKHDRNAVLRARCCEYALLVLEQWGDSPEIQRAVELYEDLIKCCVGDAMSEVRASARTCYRVFSKSWPERARRIFITFDTSVQRLVNEEDGGLQKRYGSPLVRDRGSHGQLQLLRQSAVFPVPSISQLAVTHPPPAAHCSSTIASAGRSSSTLSGLDAFVGNSSFERKSVDLNAERSPDSGFQASPQVDATDHMLRGLEISEKGTSWGCGNDQVAGIHDQGDFSTALQTSLRDSGGGSYRRIHAVSVASRMGVDSPSARDPPYPASAAVANQTVGRNSAFSVSFVGNLSSRSGVDVAGNVTGHPFAPPKIEKRARSLNCDTDGPSVSSVAGNYRAGTSMTGISLKRVPFDSKGPDSLNGDFEEVKGPKRVLKTDSMDKGFNEKRAMDSNGMPGFQRPLLRQIVPGRSSGSSRSSLEDNQVLVHFNALGETHNYMDGLMSLNDALSEGLSVCADWSARVAAFTFLRKLLQQGSKGLQDINHNFGLVMKLFSAHLDDPHHKVAHAALTTLAELVPACRKSFEGYLERVLPHVFARLVDAKEIIRQVGTTALEIVGNTYTIEALLPALLRSLDEQRSPKAKMAVIEFAIAAFAKLASNGEATGGSGLLKLWLAKLGPLANDKNPKLKETAVTGIISVYSHFDSTTVLNFILSLSIEEQSLLRRALKQYTPRIEVDLMSYLQNRSQRARSKSGYDQSEAALGTIENYMGPIKNASASLTGTQPLACNFSSSNSQDGGRRSESAQQDTIRTGIRLMNQAAGIGSKIETCRSLRSCGEVVTQVNSLPSQPGRTKEVISRNQESDRSTGCSNHAQNYRLKIDTGDNDGSSAVTGAEGFVSCELWLSASTSPEPRVINQLQSETDCKLDDKAVWKSNQKGPSQDADLFVPKLLHQMTKSGCTTPSKERQAALEQFLKLSSLNETGLWSLYFHQILTGIFEALDDPDATVRELALSVIFEMLRNQRDRLVESTEALLEKLLHSRKDVDLKNDSIQTFFRNYQNIWVYYRGEQHHRSILLTVCSAADRCLTVVLSEFDPYCCLMVVVPLLVCEDEKALVTCIGSLTKLVSRLPSLELMGQLPTFLPALFEAFGHQNADVRKTVVFCLVDIYIVLGKAFVPYLGSLSSTQLRLVTIYANRISQARTGTSLESQL